VVLRHAKARRRESWEGDDADRPLTGSGRRDAAALAPLLASYGVTRVVSSDSTRCVETVRPYADDHVLTIEAERGLTEDDWSPTAVRSVLDDLLGGKENAVVCTHRPVLPEVLTALGVIEEPLAPGEMVVCHHRKGRVVAVERHLAR
jgi:8-oxo-dGTP diphosphatase